MHLSPPSSYPRTNSSEHYFALTRIAQTQRDNFETQRILLDQVVLTHQKSIEWRVFVAHGARVVPLLWHKTRAQTRPVWGRVVVVAQARFNAI